MLRVLLSLLVLLAIAFPYGGHAQMPTTTTSEVAGVTSLPDPLTPDTIRALVSRLSDAEVRGLLLRQLDAAAEERKTEDEQSGAISQFADHLTGGTFRAVRDAIVRVPLLLDYQIHSFQTFHAKLGGYGILLFFGALALAVIGGLAAEWIVNRLTRNMHEAGSHAARDGSLRDSLRFLFSRFCHEVFGLIAFILVARAIAIALVDPAYISLAGTIMFSMVGVPRIGAAISRFLLAPNRPEFRILNVDDRSAKFLHRHQIGIFVLMGFSIAIVNFNDANGVAMGESRLGFWLNLAVHAYVIYIIWRTWDGLVAMMRGGDPDETPTEERVSRAYPVFAIVVTVLTWLLVNVLVSYGQFELLQTAPHYKMMFLLLLAPALDTLVRGLVRHLTPPIKGVGPLAERAYTSTKRSWIRVGRVLVFGLVVMSIARFWQIDLSNLAAAGVGAQFAGGFIELLMIIAVGYLVWELVSLWANRRLAAEQTAAGFDLNEEEPGGGEGGGAGGSRLSTVLPLVRVTLQIVILTMTMLIAIGHIGIDITPLLAGAGILGLAIGFGAQKLVADVVSGIFFLIDDAFRAGEYVDIGGTVGTVEKISLRSMQLRHHRGAVHTIPYGEIPKLTNYSRDWVIMKLKFTVPFDTDLNKVKKIFKQIGKDIAEIPEFAKDLLQPFKSQGVLEVDDVGIVVRGKFMAKPGKQFTLRKEVYQRVQTAFEENGLSFARKEVRVTVDVPETAELTDVERQAIAAGAADAADRALENVDGKADDR